MLPWQQNILYFRVPLILFNKCTKFLFDSDWQRLNDIWFKYWISRSNTCDVTSFVKGAQNVQFSFPFFPKISETLKTDISGMETDIIGYAAPNYHTEHGVKNKWEREWGGHASQNRESMQMKGSRNTV